MNEATQTVVDRFERMISLSRLISSWLAINTHPRRNYAIYNACIDGSELSGNICDTAVWAAQQPKAPIRLLHALEKEGRPAREDYSATIGLGSREHLLDTLTRRDEERGRSALANGKALLANASLRVKSQGVSDFVSEQRRRTTTVLSHEEQDSRLLVVGRHGTGHQGRATDRGLHRIIGAAGKHADFNGDGVFFPDPFYDCLRWQ